MLNKMMLSKDWPEQMNWRRVLDLERSEQCGDRRGVMPERQ